MTLNPCRRVSQALIVAAIVLLKVAVALEEPTEAQPEQASTGQESIVLSVKVTGGTPPVPIPLAQVLVSAKPDDGTEKSRNTNQQGVAQFAKLPAGTYRIHVSADGWKLYGADYQLAKPKEEIEIVLTQE